MTDRSRTAARPPRTAATAAASGRRSTAADAAAARRAADLAAPPVVPLGAADTLRHERGPTRTPPRARRHVHLTARAVLVGPWGGDRHGTACGQLPGACAGSGCAAAPNATPWRPAPAPHGRRATGRCSPPTPSTPCAALLDAVAGRRPRRPPAGRRRRPGRCRRSPGSTWSTLRHAGPSRCWPSRCAPTARPRARHRRGRPRMRARRPRPKPDPDALPAARRLDLPAADRRPWPTRSAARSAPAPGSTSPPPTTAPGRRQRLRARLRRAERRHLERPGQRASRPAATSPSWRAWSGTPGPTAAAAPRPVVGSYNELAATGALDPRRLRLLRPGDLPRRPAGQPLRPRPADPLGVGPLAARRPARPGARPAGRTTAPGSRRTTSSSSAPTAAPSAAAWRRPSSFGLLELVERDAFLLAWYGARPAHRDRPRLRAAARRPRPWSTGPRCTATTCTPSTTGSTWPCRSSPRWRSAATAAPARSPSRAAAALRPGAAVEAALSEVLTYIPHLPRQVGERRAELEAMADDFALGPAPQGPRPALRPARDGRARREPTSSRPPSARFGEVYARLAGRGRPRTGDLLDDLRLAAATSWRRPGHDVIVVDQTTPEQERMGLRTVAPSCPACCRSTSAGPGSGPC